MEDSYVCSGAMMKCTMGTSPARLTVLPTRTVFLTGQPMANISDHQTMVNLAPFGLCRSMGFPATASATAAALGTLTPMPCMHNTPFPWMGGKIDYLVKGQPALLKSCKCQCLWGGTISFVNDGQHGEGTQWVKQKEIEEFTNDEKGYATGSDDHNNSRTNLIAGKRFLKRKIDKFKYSPQQMQAWKRMLEKTKGEPMNDKDADDTGANPEYHTPQKDLPVVFNNKIRLSHRVNCSTTTVVFELRKRGYNVTAKGYTRNNNTAYLSKDSFDAWKTKDGKKAEPVKIRDIAVKEQKDNPQNTKTQIYYKILSEQCKEPGYYQLDLTWEEGTRHTTLIKSEKGSFKSTTKTPDGVMYIIESSIVLTNIEPQSGKSLDISTLFENMNNPANLSEKDAIMRIDDKEFNEDYLDILNFNPPKMK